eukprot:Lithocolla_globosa_v1_NODE_1090_length_2879_cov_37.449912.p2 type:complete len:129 gc:universal NODE_1090_length_2879_cov_37.449912:1390-1004(-)
MSDPVCFRNISAMTHTQCSALPRLFCKPHPIPCTHSCSYRLLGRRNQRQLDNLGTQTLQCRRIGCRLIAQDYMYSTLCPDPSTLHQYIIFYVINKRLSKQKDKFLARLNHSGFQHYVSMQLCTSIYSV